jgi:predicted porin
MRMVLLVPLAALVVASSVHAQSSVTLFGMLDVGVSYVSNEGGGHALEAADSIYTPSLIGLRGSEDLGGGYKAVVAVFARHGCRHSRSRRRLQP